MKKDLDTAISELYGHVYINKASILLLKEMFIGYVKFQNPKEAEVLDKFFNERLNQYFRDLILDSDLSEEYLSYLTEQLLKKHQD